MPIPKIIHQTFKSDKLPWLTRWQISRFRRNNPEYSYEFYDDRRINTFLAKEFDRETVDLYERINIGAAKADFFRYAVLLKKGGIYLDIDSTIKGKLSDFILPKDEAIISSENNPDLFVQWALIFAPNHPFMEKTLELVKSNIKANAYPHDVHRMTGPTVYTKAVNDVILHNPSVHYRRLGIDYERHLTFKYPLSKLLYKKGEHWKKMQLTTPVLRPESE